jgi:hypothetical protein
MSSSMAQKKLSPMENSGLWDWKKYKGQTYAHLFLISKELSIMSLFAQSIQQSIVSSILMTVFINRSYIWPTEWISNHDNPWQILP